MFAAVLTAMTLLAADANLRLWTASTGFSAKAIYVRVENDRVRLKMESGFEVLVALSVLSDDDKAYIEIQRRNAPVLPAENADQPAKPINWDIISCRVSNIAASTDGTFTLSSANFVTIVVRSPATKTASEFRLRKGENGGFVGRLNNHSAKGAAVHLLFEGVSANESDLFLCDMRGNQRSVLERPTPPTPVTRKADVTVGGQGEREKSAESNLKVAESLYASNRDADAFRTRLKRIAESYAGTKAAAQAKRQFDALAGESKNR